MIKNKCLVCGSSKLRADRSLSGRLVCTSCGYPYGVRRSASKKLNNFNTFSFGNNFWLFFSISVFIFILVIKS